MAEASVLAELMFETLPVWCEKLEKYIGEAEDARKPTSGIIITPSGAEISTPKVDDVVASGESPAHTGNGRATRDSISHLKRSLAAPHGTCRLDAKPDSTKTRFSSLTGPVIMYDGESQRMLFELWTSLNNKRGGLRREMMAVKRRQELALPKVTPNIKIECDTDADENSSTGNDEENDLQHSSEMLRLRLQLEREKMKRMSNRRAGGVGGTSMGGSPLGALSFKRARTMNMAGLSVPTAQAAASTPSSIEDQRLGALLQGVDDNLDKACRVTETVAFVWLKGDAYDGHLKLIVRQLKDTVVRIKESGFVPPKTEETASSAPVAQDTRSDSKAMPPPPPTSSPPHPNLCRKKSDITMADACAVSLVAAATMKADRTAEHAQAIISIPPSIEVGPIKDEITPAIMVDNMRATGKALGESHNPSQPRANPLDPEVIEVDDDDEGIEC